MSSPYEFMLMLCIAFLQYNPNNLESLSCFYSKNINLVRFLKDYY
jgi:hypothetical protein